MSRKNEKQGKKKKKGEIIGRKKNLMWFQKDSDVKA